MDSSAVAVVAVVLLLALCAGALFVLRRANVEGAAQPQQQARDSSAETGDAVPEVTSLQTCLYGSLRGASVDVCACMSLCDVEGRIHVLLPTTAPHTH